MKQFISIFAILLALTYISGCVPENHRTRKHKPPVKHIFSAVYVGSDNTYYTKSYNDDGDQFVIWSLQNMNSANNISQNINSSSANWSRAAVLPVDVKSTSTVVASKDGTPTKEAEEATQVQAGLDTVITKETTPEEAEEAETQAEASESASAEFDSSGGDSGASSGDSGGGDSSGGGDGGGGGGDGGGGE